MSKARTYASMKGGKEKGEREISQLTRYKSQKTLLLLFLLLLLRLLLSYVCALARTRIAKKVENIALKTGGPVVRRAFLARSSAGPRASLNA